MAPMTDTPEALAAVLPLLAPHDRIAVDTEADSLHCYFEKLCLIQISVPGSDMLIDPLAKVDLAPLWSAWSEKEIVLHGADYDLRLLRRSGCPTPSRVFDTMLAARLSGVAEFSYAALVEKYFGVKIAKASQKANWATRPLSPMMLEYAVNDTRHLAAIADILQADLERLGRMPWFRQSCERAVRSAEIDKEIDPDQLWRIPGSGHLRGRAAAIFRELWRWRDDEARRLDKPTFHILHSEKLVDAAIDLDAGRQVEIRHLRGSRADRFFAAAKRGLETDESQWPKVIRTPRNRPSQAQFDRFLELKKHRDQIAHQVQLDPSLIAPKAMLEGLAFRPDESLPKLLPWQRELLKV
jgi:ribonuclease D